MYKYEYRMRLEKTNSVIVIFIIVFKIISSIRRDKYNIITIIITIITMLIMIRRRRCTMR